MAGSCGKHLSNGGRLGQTPDQVLSAVLQDKNST
jgi:hypothetical protein